MTDAVFYFQTLENVMKRIMFSTDNRLANLVALVQEHLGVALNRLL